MEYFIFKFKMNHEKHSKGRFEKLTNFKNTNKESLGDEEVATSYKLQQFLEDVQKFTEKSQKTKEKKTLDKSTKQIPKKILLKRGLFENGFRSKPFHKGLIGENRARFKSDLNDLVKECPIPNENENNTISSSASSTNEGSYELGNEGFDINAENESQENNERLNAERIFELHQEIKSYDRDEEKELLEMLGEKYNQNLNTCESNDYHNLDYETLLANVIKKSGDYKRTFDHVDRDEIKETVWKMFQNHINEVSSIKKWLPEIDQLKEVRENINNVIYENFLKNALDYPSIIKKILTNEDIKKLAQTIVVDKADKCEQTEESYFGPSVKIDGTPSQGFSESIPFNYSKIQYKNPTSHKESFFDPNVTKSPNKENFLESLDNQPEMFSPTNHISPSNYTMTPLLAPTPTNVQPSFISSAESDSNEKSKNFNIPYSKHEYENLLSSAESSLKSINKSLGPNRLTKKDLKQRHRKIKVPADSLFQRHVTQDSPFVCLFPKRKKVYFSPHRL